jgi:outer membrane protein TolC
MEKLKTCLYVVYLVFLVTVTTGIAGWAEQGRPPAGSLMETPAAEGPVTARYPSPVPGTVPSVTLLNGLDILDLESAQSMALVANPSLEAARQRVRQAMERIRQARAAWSPSLDVEASSTYAHASENSVLADPEEIYNAGLTASWVLFDGFNRRFTIAAARYDKQALESAVRDTRRLLLLAVAESYYNAQLAREDIAIAEADETFNLKQLEQADERSRIGTGALSDVLNFRIQVNSARTALIQAKQAYEVVIYGLAALMGLPDAQLPENLELERLEREKHWELLLPQSDSLIRFALALRPDIHERCQGVRQSEAEEARRRADFFPIISLAAALDGERAGNARLGADDFGNTVGVYLTYNLFSGGETRARVSEARFKTSEAEKILEDKILSVTSEVRSAVVELQAAQEQLALQRSNSVLAKQNRDLVAKEYQTGRVSLIHLNEAQRDLVSAQGRLAKALVNLRIAWHRIEAGTSRDLKYFKK